MSELPSGTVTFLFTDIEGSTKLAQSLGDKWETLRARHHEILKSAIESNNGYVFQIIGDAFCASFHTAGDALQAAIQSQSGLQSENWGDTPIKVRMGINTGKAELQEDGQYQGYLALSQVQRIMSCGHGNQTLLSGATENLLRGQLPESIDLLDMGRHNFKGVPHAIRVFQVNVPDLQQEFLPLRTFDILPNNLPAQLTSFVGREKELDDVKRLLSNTHMLTLIGPGGTGKTRLTIQAANDVLNQYPDGVWLVDLAPILDPLLVPKTTAITIGLRNEPQRPVIDMLCDYLAKKKMLLILDNCEHLVDACAQMSNRILRAAPDVQILASSREALGIAGEVTYRVPSLGMPDVDNLPSLETLSQYEAVKLFIDRAMAAIPGFKVTNENAPALAQICHRVDGIPLAIELAAGKIRVLGVEQIAKRLDDRFKLLTGGSRTAMERHQTLRATVDWSYNLLPHEEQTLLRRLAVFRGGWTLEAAESTCGDDVLELLEQLINKSLIITEDEAGISRFRMLETIRQYANEKLVDSGESFYIRDQHMEYFLELVETAEPYLFRHEQLKWLAQLDADHENIRAAFEHSLENKSPEPSLRFSGALFLFWRIRSLWLEGSNWTQRSIERKQKQENETVDLPYIRSLFSHSYVNYVLNNYEQSLESATLCLSLAEKHGHKKYAALARLLIGDNMLVQLKIEEAYEHQRQCHTQLSELNEPYWEAISFNALQHSLHRLGKLDFSVLYTKSLNMIRKTGERYALAQQLTGLAWKNFRNNNIQESQENALEAERLYQQVGGFNPIPELFAMLEWLAGNYAQAESIYIEIQERISPFLGKDQSTEIESTLGRLALEQGNLEKAKIYFEKDLEISKKINTPINLAYSLANMSNYFFRINNTTKFKVAMSESGNIVKNADGINQNGWLVHILTSIVFFDPAKSARLLGVLHNNDSDNTDPLDPFEQRDFDKAEAHLRQTIGDQAFEVAYEEGKKMSLREGVELVLKIIEGNND